MRFEPKYTDEDVLNVLDKNKLMTAGYIAKRLGCTLQTAKTYLKSLTERNIIEVVEIDEGQITAYRLK